jgi:hypothetical protein
MSLNKRPLWHHDGGPQKHVLLLQLHVIMDEMLLAERTNKPLQQSLFRLFVNELAPDEPFRLMISAEVSKVDNFPAFIKLISQKIIQLSEVWLKFCL